MSNDHTKVGPGCISSYLLLFIILMAMFVLVLSFRALDVTAEGPSLTVHNPPEGFLTRNHRIPVTGVTEPVTEVVVLVESIFEDRSFNDTSSLNGSFEIWVYLHFDRHRLVVTAGEVGNSTTVTRNITVDSWEPLIEVEVLYENQVPVMFNETLGGYLVSEDEIFLRCPIRDFETQYSQLLVDVNGVPYYHYCEYEGVYGAWPLVEGLNRFTINATDLAGNTGTAIIDVYRDTTPPQLLMDGPLDRDLTREVNHTVEGRTEPHVYVQVHLQGATDYRTYNASSSKDGSFSVPVQLVEGLMTIVVYAVDAMGNVNMTLALVTLDTVPPEIVINQPPDGMTITRETRFVIEGTTDSEVTVAVDGIEVDNTGVFLHEVRLSEGENTFEIRATDLAGNENAVTVTILRDTVPPILFVSSPQRTHVLTNVTTVHFAGSVQKAVGVAVRHRGVHYAARLVSGSWDDGEWEYDLELEGTDVEQDIEVYALDQANNKDMATIRVVLDVMPPSLNIDVGLSRVTNLDPVTISGTTDEDIEVVTVNGEPYPATDGVFDLGIALGGASRSEFILKVQDPAGNVATKVVTVTYDTQVPELKLDYHRETDTSIVTVTGTTDKDVKWVYVDGYSYFVDNGTFTFMIELVGEGEHWINFTVEDEAGNRRTKFANIDNGGGMSEFSTTLAFISVIALVALVVVIVSRRARKP